MGLPRLQLFTIQRLHFNPHKWNTLETKLGRGNHKEFLDWRNDKPLYLSSDRQWDTLPGTKAEKTEFTA